MTRPDGPDSRGTGDGLRLLRRTDLDLTSRSLLLRVLEGSSSRQHVMAASCRTTVEGWSRYAATTTPTKGRIVEQADVESRVVSRENLDRVDRDSVSDDTVAGLAQM